MKEGDSGNIELGYFLMGILTALFLHGIFTVIEDSTGQDQEINVPDFARKMCNEKGYDLGKVEYTQDGTYGKIPKIYCKEYKNETAKPLEDGYLLLEK